MKTLNKRRCEICKKEEAPGVMAVSPFSYTLKRLGYTDGDYAHHVCLRRIQKAIGSKRTAEWLHRREHA